MILRILFTLLRKTIIFVSPLLIIFTSVAINLPNTDLHKQTLVKQNFYQKLSTEIRNLSNKIVDGSAIKPNSLQDSLKQSYYGYILPEISTKEWLQNETEKNLDLFKVWLNDEKDDEFKLADMTEVFTNSSNKNSEKISEFLRQTSNQNRECTETEKNQILNQNLNCYISKPISNQSFFENFETINNYNLFAPLKYLKSSYKFSKNFIIPITILYLSLIIFVIVGTKITSGESKKTVEMITGRIGYSTLISSLILFLGLNITIYTGFFANSFFSGIVNTVGLTNLIQSQLSFHIWVILAPSVYAGVIFIAMNLITKILPKF